MRLMGWAGGVGSGRKGNEMMEESKEAAREESRLVDSNLPLNLLFPSPLSDDMLSPHKATST
jgi:hypothetical protein